MFCLPFHMRCHLSFKSLPLAGKDTGVSYLFACFCFLRKRVPIFGISKVQNLEIAYLDVWSYK